MAIQRKFNPERMPKPLPRLISQAAAARILGMSRNTVTSRIAAGELESEMVDTTPVVVRASVEAYLKRQRAAA